MGLGFRRRTPGISMEPGRQLGQRGLAALTRKLLRPRQFGPRRRQLVTRQPSVPLELIEVGPGQRKTRRPDQLRLSLGVQVLEPHRLGGGNLVRRQETARYQLEDVEPAGNFRTHHVAVVPIHRPRPPTHQLGRIDRAPVVERDLGGFGRVGPIEDRNPALIPPLDHHIAAGNRNQRAVVGNAILERRLGGRHLVVALELHLPVDDREESVGAPLVLVGGAATGRRPATPFVSEENLRAVVAEGGRVPERKIRIRRGGNPNRMGHVADVEQKTVAAAGTAREADGRIDGDVVTLGRAATGAGLGRTRRAVGRPGEFGGVDQVGMAGRDGQVLEDPGRADDLGLLRRGERHLDDLDPEQGRVRIVFRHRPRATRQFFVGANAGGTGDIDIDVVLVLRIDHHGVGVGPAAGLDVGEVLRVTDVGGVENSNPTEPLVAHGFLDPLGAAIEPAGQALARDEQQIPVHRHVTLRRRAEVGFLERRPIRVGNVPDVETVVVALDDVVAPEREIRVAGRFEARRRWGVGHQPDVPGRHPGVGLPRAEADPRVGARGRGGHIGGRRGRAT